MGSKAKDVNFINTKVFEGGKYTGGVKESFQTWAKKVKIYFDFQHCGARRALELSVDAITKAAVGDLKL